MNRIQLLILTAFTVVAFHNSPVAASAASKKSDLKAHAKEFIPKSASAATATAAQPPVHSTHDAKSAVESSDSEQRLTEDELIQELLNKTQSQDSLDKCLIAAAHKGLYRLMQELILLGANVHTTDAQSNNALMILCSEELGEEKDELNNVVYCLLSKGVLASYPDHNGHTPLMMASFKCNLSAVQALLQHNREIFTMNELNQAMRLAQYAAKNVPQKADEYTLIMYEIDAYKFEQLDSQRNEVDGKHAGEMQAHAPVTIQAQVSLDKDSLLTRLRNELADHILHNSEDVLALISHARQTLNNVDDFLEMIELTDAHGDSLLTLAARTGNLNVVKELLLNGANREHANHRGETALSIAFKIDDLMMAYFLLAHEYPEQAY